MNCRTVRMMAIAIGVCVITATASHALAAKDKGKHGVVVSISADSLTVTETDKKAGTTANNTYPISDSVSFTIDGAPVDGKFADVVKDKTKIDVGDKITFKLADGKVSVIAKGHKKKAPK